MPMRKTRGVENSTGQTNFLTFLPSDVNPNWTVNQNAMLIRASTQFQRQYVCTLNERDALVQQFPQSWNVDVLPHDWSQLLVLASEEHSLSFTLFPAITKLGGATRLHGGLFTPSATTSILCVLNWLKSQRKKRILAMCPVYFSLAHACRRFGLTLNRAYLKRSNGGFTLPPANSSIWRTPSVLWLTNPVYGAGVYLSKDNLLFITGLLKSGWTVVADECLALPGQEMIRSFGEHENFVSIYSPHKNVCVNGIKFSVILFGRKHLAFMERWADVWYGGLGCSSSLAINHFLSANFDSYQSVFLNAIARQREIFSQLCQKHNIETDDKAKGHFVSCYFATLSSW